MSHDQQVIQLRHRIEHTELAYENSSFRMGPQRSAELGALKQQLRELTAGEVAP